MNEKKVKLFLYKMNLVFLLLGAIIPKTNYNVKEVVFLDERHMDDPNIKVIDSYLINDLYSMNKVVNEIIEYNTIYNTNEWSRSKISLLIEWTVHNICYDLGIKRENTVDVDFRNSEESLYTLGLKKD